MQADVCLTFKPPWWLILSIVCSYFFFPEYSIDFCFCHRKIVLNHADVLFLLKDIKGNIKGI